MSKINKILQMAGLAATLPFLAATALADDLPEEFMSCAAESNDQLRLVCYDREMARLQPVVAEQIAVAPTSDADATANAKDPAAAVADVELRHQEGSTAMTVAVAASVPQPTATESATISSAPASSNSQGASNVTSVPDVDPPQPASATMSALATQPAPDPQPENASPSPLDAGETSAIVTKIARQPHGEHVVYLDNGQVWAEQSRSSYFPVEPGDTISIKKRRFTGFRLLTETGKGFNVERLR